PNPVGTPATGPTTSQAGSATPITPITPPTVAGAAAGAAGSAAPDPNATPDSSQIMSSMVMPMYQQYMAALNQANGLNTQTTTMANQAADANAAASTSQLAQQTQTGLNQNQQQQTAAGVQNDSAQAQLNAAMAGSHVVGDTGAIQYHSDIQTNYQNAMTQLQQAAQQLQMSQTTGDAQINAQDLQAKVTAAQNSIQNLTSIASAGYNAALGLGQYQQQSDAFALQQQEYQLSAQQTTQAIQQANQQFAANYGVTTPFYNMGGTIYRTSDGKAYPNQAAAQADGWTPDNKNSMTVNPNQQQQSQFVYNLATTYPGANIGPNDTMQQAEEKVAQSAQYQATVDAINGGNTNIKIPTSVAKYLSPTVSTPAYDAVDSALQQYMASLPLNMDNATQAQKYQEWGQVASTIDQMGKDPTSPVYGLSSSDFDALLWSQFAPGGLASYISQYATTAAKGSTQTP
ncbi:unnamed protein product, partial [Sphagnum balticum]